MMCCGAWRVLDPKEATAVCTVCGDVVPHQPEEVDRHTMNAATSVRRKAKYVYKRLGHFRLWLDRLQGLDHVPDPVLADVHAHLASLPIAVPSAARVRAALREVGRPEHFNSIPAIRWRLYCVAPFRLTQAQRCDVESMFYDVEEAFARLRGGRRNMLSYAFVLKRMLLLLGVECRLDDLKDMKHEGKIAEADELWAAICADLGFDFEPTPK